MSGHESPSLKQKWIRRGAAALEYCLLLSVIAVVLVTSVKRIGLAINGAAAKTGAAISVGEPGISVTSDEDSQ